MVDAEFEAIWKQVTQQMEQAGRRSKTRTKPRTKPREQYRDVAERRVRLGLVIGEIGESNKVEVTQDELRTGLLEEARQYPGQEELVYEYYEKTPGAIAQLRAPIFRGQGRRSDRRVRPR